MKLAHDYEGLCLSSGAAGGYSILGTLHFIYTHSKSLKHTSYFIGSSAGSAIALLLAAGFTPVEIFSHLCSKNINNIFDLNIDIPLLTEKWGIVNLENYRKYLDELLCEKLGYSPTFKQLKQLGKTFICTAWCLTSQNHETYFNPNDNPDMKCSEAVCCSCCIPVIFTKACYNNNIYIDGGMFNRCPSEYLHEYMGEELLEGYKILAIDLWQPNKDVKCANIIEYVKEIAMISMKMQKPICSTKDIDVLRIQNDFEEVTLKVETKKRIEIFEKASDKAKKQLS